MTHTLHVIGGGLAGCEAAWQAAESGCDVILHEMRPTRGTEAHKTDGLAELVCSNSFRSDEWRINAVGLLHEEMRRMDSVILKCADATRVPAGAALAVDRDAFSEHVSRAMENHPRITIDRTEVTGLPPSDWQQVIIATGPLTSDPLATAIQDLTGEDALAFFDAIAPIIHADTIDYDIAWAQSRWDKGEGLGGTGKDYINCPMTRDEYYHFIDEVVAAEKTVYKEWEANTPYFNGCMPVEVMAERGRDTLRFGPMKPIGLTDPKTNRRPYAVVQLRQDNALATLFNMVGFQTKMKHGEQIRVLRLIPGLQNAEFARLGGLHRNTFIHSPKLLDMQLRLKKQPRLRFAGQITGVEGYVESAAMGLLAGRFASAELHGIQMESPPATTALGALLVHITGGANADNFQPMNANFGLFPPLPEAVHKSQRKLAMAERALAELAAWMGVPQPIAA
jgi:methylenetetrahydrofolate--tRNA-(uracil-5-)-methyltransferase